MASEKVSNKDGAFNEGFTITEQDEEVKTNGINFSKSVAVNKQNFYDFEVILEELGSLGKYQLFLTILVCWTTIPTGIFAFSSVFIEAIPNHRCNLQGIENLSALNLTEEKKVSYFLPINPIYGWYEQCSRYDFNLTSCNSSLDCFQPSNILSTIPCDNGLWFDTSLYGSTVTSEFELVCDKASLKSAMISIYFVGILLSSIIGGSLIDRYGRVPMMLLSEIMVISIGIATAYVQSVAVFIVLKTAMALFIQAGFIGCFVYVMEITSQKWRSFMGIMTQMGFAIGVISLSGFAYKWRNWRNLQIAISFVPIPFILFWFFVPESPRWLFSKNKNKKAVKICEKIAEKNDKKLSENIWERSIQSGSLLKKNTSENQNYSPIVLFKKAKIRKTTLNVMFNWFVNSLVYYGLSLNVGSLAGDVYLNNALSGIVEAAAYLICAFTIDRFSRKKLLAGCLLVGGTFCLVSTVFNHFAAGKIAMVHSGTAFALLGKMAVSASFSVIYNYTSELYPTPVRSTAVGLGTMSSVVSGIITPWTIQAEMKIPWISGVIFGLLALSAGFLSFLLPETRGRKLPTTIEEAEKFY